MNDEVAASLILQAIEKYQNSASTTHLFDIRVNRIYTKDEDDKFVSFTFYAYLPGKSKSITQILTETLLKESVKKLLMKKSLAGVAKKTYSIIARLTKAEVVQDGRGINTNNIGSSAATLGWQLQLDAAKKMGQKNYEEACTFGLKAEIVYGGVIRFEALEYGDDCKGLNIVMRYWSKDHALGFVDKFQGRCENFNNTTAIKNLVKEWSAEHCVDYVYSHATGQMWK